MASRYPGGRAVPPFTTRGGRRTHRQGVSCHSQSYAATTWPAPVLWLTGRTEQFAADALGAPERIAGSHALDEGDRLRRDWRPADLRARLPGPEEAEALP